MLRPPSFSLLTGAAELRQPVLSCARLGEGGSGGIRALRPDWSDSLASKLRTDSERSFDLDEARDVKAATCETEFESGGVRTYRGFESPAGLCTN